MRRSFEELSFPAVVAHRGVPTRRPENTLASFEEAIRLGAPIVEFDVRLTRDGEPVVLHDPTVERTTDGTGAVHEMNLDDVRALDAGDGEPVPTLVEALDTLDGRAGAAIEVKVLPGEAGHTAGDASVVRALHETLASTGFAGPTLVISFNPEWVETSRAIDPDVPTGFLTTSFVDPDEALVYAVGAGHALVLPGTRSLEPVGEAFVDRAHASGVRVGTWTVDEADAMRRFVAMGVDAIATNDAAMALDTLART